MGLTVGCSDIVSASAAKCTLQTGSRALPGGDGKEIMQVPARVSQASTDSAQCGDRRGFASGKPGEAGKAAAQRALADNVSEAGDDCSSVADSQTDASSMTDGNRSLAESDGESTKGDKVEAPAEEAVDEMEDPLGALRKLLKDGKLRRRDAEELEEELSTVNEGRLVQALAGALDRQHMYGVHHNRPPRFIPPRELLWNKKRSPTVHHGASFTEAAIAPAHVTEEWRNIGFGALAHSQVGVVVICGATGADCIADLGLPSGKSLLRIFCERLRRLAHLAKRHSSAVSPPPRSVLTVSRGGGAAKCRIPLYIMTNAGNHFEVEAHFKDNDYFGLDEKDVRVFPQPSEPIVSTEGHAIIAEPWELARAPGGSGACFEVLQKSGAQLDMHKRGLSHVHIMGCDNVLSRIGDPLLLGFCLKLKSQCCLKVVWRSGTSDPFGTLCTHHERKDPHAKARVMERHEMHDEARRGKAHDGKLRLRISSLGEYVLTLDLLDDSFRPPLLQPHAVPTSSPWYDAEARCMRQPNYGKRGHSGNELKGKVLNALRMETFVSDVFDKLDRLPALLVERAKEFLAVKLADGSGTISQTVLAVSLLHQSWIIEAGGTFREGDEASRVGELCEVSPLVSYSGEGLDGHFFGIQELPLRLDAFGESAANYCGASGAPPDHAIAEQCSEGEELPPTPRSDGEENAVIGLGIYRRQAAAAEDGDGGAAPTKRPSMTASPRRSTTSSRRKSTGRWERACSQADVGKPVDEAN